MGRKNSPSANKELNELIAQYETAKAENRQLYLDGEPTLLTDTLPNGNSTKRKRS